MRRRFSYSRWCFSPRSWGLPILALGLFCIASGGRGAIAQPTPSLPPLPPAFPIGDVPPLPCLPSSLPIFTNPRLYSPRPFNPNARNRQKIAIQYAALGQYDRAAEIATELPDASYQSATLLEIADLALTKGERNLAVVILEQVLQLPPTLEVDEQAAIFADIAVKFAAAGQVERGLQLARRQENEWEQQRTVASIIVKLAETGQISQALQLAQATPGVANQVWPAIVRAAIAAGKYTQGVEIASNLENRCDRAGALQQASTSLFRAGQEELALEVAQAIAEAKYKVEALTSIAAQLLEAERTEEALPILTLALEATPALSPYQKADALIAIARHLIVAGEGKQAEALLSRALALSKSVGPPSRTISPRLQPEQQ